MNCTFILGAFVTHCDPILVCTMQLTAQVCDEGFPPKCDQAYIQFNVDSNEQRPIFTDPDNIGGYQVTRLVREDIATSFNIFTFSVQDGDAGVGVS